MKKLTYITAILLGLLISNVSFGQSRVLQDEGGVVITNQDTVVIKIDKDEKESSDKKKKKNKFRVGLVDYGVSSYLVRGSFSEDIPEEWSLKYPQSINWNIHIFRHRLNLISETLFFEYGISTNFRRFRFENNVESIQVGDNTIRPIISNTDFKKSKLRTTYLEVPLMVTINPKGKKFTLSLGAYGGMRIGSSHKIKTTDGEKMVNKDDFKLRDFTSGLVARLGFGPVDFYCQVNGESMFDDSISPNLAPLTFGISLINF